MEFLLLLLTAHFIGDFYLQPDKWVHCRNKEKLKSPGLWKHIGVHGLLNTMVFWYTQHTLGLSVVCILVICASHLLADWLKAHSENGMFAFTADQAFHLLVIALVWSYVSGYSINEVMTAVNGIVTAKHLVILMAYLLVCKPASVLVSIALKRQTDDLKAVPATVPAAQVDVVKTTDNKVTVTVQPNQTSQEANTAEQDSQNSGLISAGELIGYIERCLAISFIFMGQFVGLGFLVATKTVFRFGDLTKSKDMKLTEYMMLGTLLSYAIALLIGWVALHLYKLL